MVLLFNLKQRVVLTNAVGQHDRGCGADISVHVVSCFYIISFFYVLFPFPSGVSASTSHGSASQSAARCGFTAVWFYKVVYNGFMLHTCCNRLFLLNSQTYFAGCERLLCNLKSASRLFLILI